MNMPERGGGGAMTAGDLHDIQLDFALHADVLQRALGHGGAPMDLQRARRTIPYVQAVLYRLLEQLPDVKK
jgi:hypothetical protein